MYIYESNRLVLLGGASPVSICRSARSTLSLASFQISWASWHSLSWLNHTAPCQHGQCSGHPQAPAWGLSPCVWPGPLHPLYPRGQGGPGRWVSSTVGAVWLWCHLIQVRVHFQVASSRQLDVSNDGVLCRWSLGVTCQVFLFSPDCHMM